ncbi:hypothetical protein Ddc_16985 [Ditylenchus destructor]|nr:hypothetical protein Ddc_16985 [Ditylenchus destructor]
MQPVRYIIHSRMLIFLKNVLLQHPNIYALRAVDLSINRRLSGDEISQLVEQKASYLESDTIFFVLESAKRSIDLAMEIIRQEKKNPLAQTKIDDSKGKTGILYAYVSFSTIDKVT